MKITLIAAVDDALGIGAQGCLPWRNSDDLKHFQRYTMGKHVLCGSKTFLGIPGGLPGREVLMLSRTLQKVQGARLVGSVQEAIRVASDEGCEELVVIGGAQVYQQTLWLAHSLVLTRVDGVHPECDAFFPSSCLGLFKREEEHAYPWGTVEIWERQYGQSGRIS